MTLLLWAGYVLAALLVAALLTLLFIRSGVEGYGTDGSLAVDFFVGPVRVPIYRYDKDKPKKKREKQRKTEQEPQLDNDMPAPQLSQDKLSRLRDLLGELVGRLTLEKFSLFIRFAGDDAAKTALLLGQASAAAGMLVPFLHRLFIVQDCRITLDADFEKKQTEWAAKFRLRLRLVRLLPLIPKIRRSIKDFTEKPIFDTKNSA